MPAVRLQDIQQRAHALWEVWTQRPDAFHRALTFTWEKFGFRGHKPGQTRLPDELPTYHVPKGVLHGLAQTWQRLLQANPEARDAFLQDLWSHPVLESRRAALLLWAMQPRMTLQDLARFWAWLPETEHNPTLHRTLLEHLAPRLAREQTRAYSDRLFRRLEQAQPQDLPRLLPLLVPLLTAPGFDDFPTLRQRLTPWLTPPSREALPEWVPVLRALFRRWPGEAMPWVRRMVHRYPGETWTWLLRRLYPWVEEPWRTRLRRLEKA